MEIQSDSYVGKALKKTDGGLPQWPGVINLTEAVSAEFQGVVSRVAAGEGTFRVHLDIGVSAARLPTTMEELKMRGIKPAWVTPYG